VSLEKEINALASPDKTIQAEARQALIAAGTAAIAPLMVRRLARAAEAQQS
jgi:hypothetical protein